MEIPYKALTCSIWKGFHFLYKGGKGYYDYLVRGITLILRDSCIYVVLLLVLCKMEKAYFYFLQNIEVFHPDNSMMEKKS